MPNAQAAFCGRLVLPHFAAVTGMRTRRTQWQRLEFISGRQILLHQNRESAWMDGNKSRAT
jgi:hypothetical protein